MFWCKNETLDLEYSLTLRALFPEEIYRDLSQLAVVRPLGWSGCCTVTCRYVCVTAFWGAATQQRWRCIILRADDNNSK